jgi:hypothetical protein
MSFPVLASFLVRDPDPMSRFDSRSFRALLLLSCSALAVASGPAASPGSGASLESALSTVSPEKMKRDLFVIASDEMGGRDTPSPGLEATAQYIRTRLEELGWAPGAPEGFFYEYALSHMEIDAKRTKVVAEGRGQTLDLALGTDYFLARTSEATDLDVSGKAVFLGRWSELEAAKAALAKAGKTLEGSWVVLVEDTGTTKKITESLQEAGAVGLVMIEAEGTDKPYAERYGRTTQALLEAHASRLDARRSPATVFPKVYVPREAGLRLVRLARDEEGFPPPGTALDLSVTEHRHLTSPGGRALLKNVCGFWQGNDPALANQVIILSAHYDHVGQHDGEIFNGADDNGSGTTGMLAIAEALKTYGPMRRSVMLMWVSAEEKGLLGSQAWTERPWLPADDYPVADINIDMIGRNAPDHLLITPTSALEKEYNGLTRLAEQFGPLEGFPALGSADEYWFRSDQANFAQNLGLPVAFLFADVHEDYHRPTDHPDKIDYDKMRRIVRLVLRMLDGMQTDELKLHERAIPTQAEFLDHERSGTALRDLEKIRAAVEAFDSWNGHYPASVAELTAFDGGPRKWFPGHALPMDPWGHAYVVALPSGTEAASYTSLGSDGATGGEGTAADIVLP